MKQLFANSIRCNFYLRSSKREKPTKIVAVIQLGKKKEYFSVGLSVIPSQWNRSKQIAVISNINTELDNHNNNLLNEKLSTIRGKFEEIKTYLCANPNEIEGYCFSKQFDTHKSKSQQMNAKATNILEEAFSYYYKYIRQNTKPKSIEVQRQNVTAFCKYVKEEGVKDTTALLTQKGLNDYKRYLIDKTTLANKTINARCIFIVTLINKVIKTQNEFARYKVKESVEYNHLDQRNDKEKGKNFALTNEEIEAIKRVELQKELSIVRDIFVLQLLCGQRISDVAQYLSNQNTERVEREGKTIVILKTKKEGTTSTFEETNEMKALISKYKVTTEKGKVCVSFEEDDFVLSDEIFPFNRRLKRIARKANLVREYTYYNTTTRKEETKPICELISSHCARHTFASMKQLEGYSKEQIAIMIGHTNTDMLNKVYAHNDKEANIKNILGGANEIAPIQQSKTKKRVNVLSYLFASELIQRYFALYDEGVLDRPLLYKIDNLLRDTDKLTEAVQIYNEADEEQQNQFRKEIERLQPYVLTITTHTNKEESYLYFQHKAKTILGTLSIPTYTREQISDFICGENNMLNR